MKEPFKVYSNVDHHEGKESFQIKRMQDIFKRSEGRPDKPHRHNYYTMIILSNGKGVHNIDFTSYPLGQREVHFVSPGQVHQVVESEMSEGYVLTFEERFLVLNGIDPGFITRINLFRELGDTPPLQLSSMEFAHVRAHCEAMLSLCEDEGQFIYEALGAYLKLILIACNRSCSDPLNSDNRTYQAGMSILSEFKKLVAGNYASEHNVQFYAAKLVITPDHLNKTIKSLTGITAKEHIAHRIIIESKRMLSFTRQAAKEVGYELGFKDPAHFSSFFKRQTGMTPTQFRKQAEWAG